MAPPCIAVLLQKLVLPVKHIEMLTAVVIAPPLYAELLMKLLIQVNVSTVLSV